ncbi:AAA family ATPase [Rhodococcus sp. 24CO]|uniref:AAA family ATPase n=1 Tax=Rhodococcus sp. 24CO TaxID=3117460 RepID=UPI003D34408A
MRAPSSSAVTAFERVRDAFTATGLAFVESGSGRASAQAPGHSERDRSVSVRDVGAQVLIHSHSDPTEDVLDALGLTLADLFDSPKGVAYEYRDGRTVHRSPNKRFRQTGNTNGTACLYRLDRIVDAHTIYLAEGEKDVHALETEGVAATCTPQGAGKANLCDLTPLHGKHVVIVQDKDDPGRRHAAQVVELLSGRARSVSIVEAKSGKDAADHIAAGHLVTDFVEVARLRPGRELVATPASQVEARRVRWLFDAWLILGGLNLLAGREGLGKSTLAVWLAASVTRGSLKGELYGTPRNVIYLCTEDDPGYTVRPRLQAADANLDRVQFVNVRTDGGEADGTVSLPGDLRELERLIAEHDVALVVLDAATSVMDSRIDGHDDRKVRQFLEPLNRSAARLDYCVLGICHFGKKDSNDTGKLILGSLAWSQVPRSVLAVAKRPNTDELVITNTKSNLAPETPSASVRIVPALVETLDGPTSVGRIEWGGETTDDARDLLASSDEDDDREGVAAWLHDFLEEQGLAPAKDVKDAARKVGYSERVVQRTAKRLRVIYHHRGFPRTTHWSLPDFQTPDSP